MKERMGKWSEQIWQFECVDGDRWLYRHTDGWTDGWVEERGKVLIRRDRIACPKSDICM